MNIQLITTDKKRFLSLLLLADEQESMIDRYLGRGELFVMHGTQETETVAVAVVTNERNGVYELKNLAVAPACQRKGYGRQMVEYLCRHYADVCHTLLVGTGESRQTIAFYESCGFSYSHTVADFFTLNYDHPIVEEGKVLKDMIYFQKKLNSNR
ncbi:MAG TPA: GNAT family N-acetyltransferase [Bacteroides togonis]|nr:GNAT family N-acetyltransferase [Bacteroides togonis]